MPACQIQTALILLPIALYLLLTLIFLKETGVRQAIEAFIKGHLALFSFILITTEFLSWPKKISFSYIFAAWFLFLVVCLIMAFRRRNNHRTPSPELQNTTPLAKICTGVIFFILTATLATALIYPPNTWDSMTYHMPRVAHWITNGSVAFYPTAIARQLYQMPLAEFAIMNLQILTGCDFYANLVQWVCFVSIIGLVILIACELGLSDEQQLISAIIVATLPMAILQASSTQNDLVVSSFLLSFGLFMLKLYKNLNFENLLCAATSLGFALLTKGTAYLYGAAIGTTLAVPVLIKHGASRVKLLKTSALILLIVGIALLINAGHLWRNYRLYGHPLSTEGDQFRNEDMSAMILASNILRNIALHLGTSSGPINCYQYRALQTILGSQLDNPKSTWKGTRFNIPFDYHEDTAGNFIHMLIALFGLILLRIKRYPPKALWYAASLLFGGILYCWVLKWQPWASRLHTPLFVLSAPLLAINLTSNAKTAKSRFSQIAILCMVLYSIPFTVGNLSRSLVSLDWITLDRMHLYFNNNKNLYDDFRSAIKLLSKQNQQEIGLYIGEDDWEYPFWVLARQPDMNGKRLSFEHIGVTNISCTIDKNVLLPQFVVATKPFQTWEYASEYTIVYESEHIKVFRKSL